jgi:hypothetical protein
MPGASESHRVLGKQRATPNSEAATTTSNIRNWLAHYIMERTIEHKRPPFGGPLRW